MVKRKSAKQTESSLSSRETQKAYEEEFKKQPKVKFAEKKDDARKDKHASKGASTAPTPAPRQSKQDKNKSDIGKNKSDNSDNKADGARSISDQTKRAQEKLDIQAKRAKEYELVESIKDVFDKDGTGLVDGQQMRLLLGSLGNKLGKHELGVISQFEDKEGRVQYEQLIKTIIYE